MTRRELVRDHVEQERERDRQRCQLLADEHAALVEAYQKLWADYALLRATHTSSNRLALTPFRRIVGGTLRLATYGRAALRRRIAARGR